MPRIKTGISFRVGTKNFSTANEAFDQFMSQFNFIRQKLGDVTRPFNYIAGALIPRIKARFDTGELANPPYRETTIPRSRFTKAARKAKRTLPDGPTLKQTGNLQRAIERKKSPTKSKIGTQREVFRLVIGVNSGIAPYYKTQLMGGTWIVPIRTGPKGGEWFDPDRLEGSQMTSEQFWGPKKWSQLSLYPTSARVVEIPPTNFFYISTEDERVINRIFVKWYGKTFLRWIKMQGEVPF